MRLCKCGLSSSSGSSSWVSNCRQQHWRGRVQPFGRSLELCPVDHACRCRLPDCWIERAAHRRGWCRAHRTSASSPQLPRCAVPCLSARITSPLSSATVSFVSSLVLLCVSLEYVRLLLPWPMEDTGAWFWGRPPWGKYSCTCMTYFDFNALGKIGKM